jgi:protein-S-isoprenylcysteine O-methyltransferase Ste14
MRRSVHGHTVCVMANVLGWALNLTLWGWLAAELIMQVRQYRMGGKAKLTEWGSLGAIVVAIAVGTVLATVTLHSLPGWRIPLDTVPIALPVLWLGIGFRLWAIHTLGRFFRGVVHVQADHEVVGRTGFCGIRRTRGRWSRSSAWD